MKSIDILLHPVRMRIVQALVELERATTAEIIEHLPNTPAASTYRQVSKLHEAGILVVVDERAVRGVAERTYALDEKSVRIDPTDAAALTTEKMKLFFRFYMAGMTNLFDEYFESEERDFAHDNVGFSQTSFWANDEEMSQFIGTVAAATEKLCRNNAEGRKRYTIGTMMVPGKSNKRKGGV
ncbi:MAG: helix-turn-helix domain-containing protein [Candidatus Saccharibacteria bacterium]|nr:helix-turn-helix domain-containing protein [Candidatus Saccharibacteria bacterium]